MDHSRPLFVFILVLFTIQFNYKLNKAGIRTQGCKMLGAEESTELPGGGHPKRNNL